MMMFEKRPVKEGLTEYRQRLLSALETVAEAMAEIVGKIQPNHWHIPGKPGGYSPHYILTRLLVLEEHVYATHLRCILDEDKRELTHYDEVAWMALHYDPEKPLIAILDEFMRLRKEEVEKLRSLTTGDWNRLSRHPRLGVRTLQWWVEHQLDVSRQHLRELEVSLLNER